MDDTFEILAWVVVIFVIIGLIVVDMAESDPGLPESNPAIVEDGGTTYPMEWARVEPPPGCLEYYVAVWDTMTFDRAMGHAVGWCAVEDQDYE